MMSTRRPQGVVIIKADGREVPCELTDLGVDEDGIRQWEAAGEFNPQDGDQITVAVWPGKTGIAFQTRKDDRNG